MVCAGQSVVIGYYSLAVGAVEHSGVPARVSRDLARHPIPVMLLARLAVDRAQQGRGLGKALIKDGVLRTAEAADIAGIRAFLMHAKAVGFVAYGLITDVSIWFILLAALALLFL